MFKMSKTGLCCANKNGCQFKINLSADGKYVYKNGGKNGSQLVSFLMMAQQKSFNFSFFEKAPLVGLTDQTK